MADDNELDIPNPMDLVDTLESYFDSVGDTLDGIKDSFGDMLKDSGRNCSVFKSIGSSIQSAIADFKDGVNKALEATEQAICEIISKVGELIKSVENAIKYIKNKIQAVIQKIIDKANEIIGEIYDKIQQAISTVTDVIDGIIDQITENINDVIQSIKDMSMEFMKSFDLPSIRLCANLQTPIGDLPIDIGVDDIIDGVKAEAEDFIEKNMTATANQVKSAGVKLKGNLDNLGQGVTEELKIKKSFNSIEELLDTL